MYNNCVIANADLFYQQVMNKSHIHMYVISAGLLMPSMTGKRVLLNFTHMLFIHPTLFMVMISEAGGEGNLMICPSQWIKDTNIKIGLLN